MGIAIFKIFIWGGISSVIWSEITFYGSADASSEDEISDHITIYTSSNERFEYSYPLNIIILNISRMNLRLAMSQKGNRGN